MATSYAPGSSYATPAPATPTGFRQKNYDRALNKWVASDQRYKALFQDTVILRDPTAMEMLEQVDLDFTPKLWREGSMTPDGEFIPSGKFNVHRADTKALLQIDVSGGYSCTPYSELLVLPQDLEIPLESGESILANEALTPICVCSWQNGKSAHIQYKLAEFEPVPGDKYVSYLTIVAYLDGTASKAFLTITRIKCENTMAHALQDFNKLARADREKLSIRRHSNMSQNLGVWQGHIVSAMLNNEKFVKTFEILHQSRLQNAEKVMLNALTSLFGLEDSLNGDGKGKTQAQNRLDELVEGVRHGKGQTGSNPQTVLELYNGLTWNLTWNQNFKSVKGWSDSDLREKATWNTLVNNEGSQQAEALAYVMQLVA